MEKKDIDSIAYLINEAKRNNGPKPIVFLGAGASISAGIPGADQIVNDIIALYSDKPEIKKIIQGKYDYYSIMKCLNTTERHDLLRKYISNERVKINLTHIYLAQLLNEGLIDYILTVNFDDLILRACALFNFIPPVYDISIFKDFTTTSLPAKSVTYLHGQHHGFWLLNTDDELKKVEASIPNILNKICNGRTWIVLGYSGEDTIFDKIAALGRFDNDLYWVGYRDVEPILKVQENLLNKSNTNSYWVAGYDADSFLLKLHSELKLETPEIFNRPFSFLNKLLSNLKDIKDSREPKREIEENNLIASTLIASPEHLEKISERLSLSKKWVEDAIHRYEIADNRTVSLTNEEIDVDQLKQEIIEAIIKQEFLEAEKLQEKLNKKSTPELKVLLSTLFYNWALELKSQLNYETSLEKFNISSILDPYDDSTLINWGLTLMEIGKIKKEKSLFDECFKKFGKSLELNPSNYTIYVNWGIALYEYGKLFNETNSYLESMNYYRKAVEMHPNSDVAFNNWAVVTYEIAKQKNDDTLFNECFQKYEHAAKLNPRNYLPVFNIALVFQELGRIRRDKEFLKKALQKYELANSILPNSNTIYTNWGFALYELAQMTRNEDLYIESINKYKKAIKLNPNDYDAYLKWGNSLFQLGDLNKNSEKLQESIEKYKIAQKLNPEDAVVFYYLGNTYQKLAEITNDSKWIEKSLEKYEVAIQLDPKKNEAYNYKATALINYSYFLSDDSKQNYLIQARETSKKAVELGANRYNLACSYALLKDRDLALFNLEDTLKNGSVTTDIVLNDKDWTYYFEDENFKTLLLKYSQK